MTVEKHMYYFSFTSSFLACIVNMIRNKRSKQCYAKKLQLKFSNACIDWINRFKNSYYSCSVTFLKTTFFDSVWFDEIKPYLLLSEVKNKINIFPNLVWGAGKTSGNSLTNDNSQVLIHNISIFSKNQRKPMSGSLSQSWYYHVGAVLFSWF